MLLIYSQGPGCVHHFHRSEIQRRRPYRVSLVLNTETGFDYLGITKLLESEPDLTLSTREEEIFTIHDDDRRSS